MPGKTLSPIETIAQLAERPRFRAAPNGRRATPATEAATAANRRPIGNQGDAVRRHKFRVGETVTLVPNRYGANRFGGFKVTSLLPQEQGVNQYRLKSNADGHERVASENELN